MKSNDISKHSSYKRVLQVENQPRPLFFASDTFKVTPRWFAQFRASASINSGVGLRILKKRVLHSSMNKFAN
jgi:hypothetical protein